MVPKRSISRLSISRQIEYNYNDFKVFYEL
jgi:hypothetical protein